MSNTNVVDSKRKKKHMQKYVRCYFKHNLCHLNLINSNQLNNVYKTEKFELSRTYYELYLEKEKKQTFSKTHFSFAFSSGCSELDSFSKKFLYF